MNIIGLIGSPRKGGNTDVLVQACLEGAIAAGATGRLLYLDDLNIRPIGDVGDVPSNQRVDIRRDDDFPKVLEQFLHADIAILGSPVYWLGVSAQMKCFIDRCSSYFRVAPYAEGFTGKGYLVICTFGRPDPDHGRWITDPMKICVEVLRGKYLGDLCVSVPTPTCGAVRQNAKAIQAALELGKTAVRSMASSGLHKPG